MKSMIICATLATSVFSAFAMESSISLNPVAFTISEKSAFAPYRKRKLDAITTNVDSVNEVAEPMVKRAKVGYQLDDGRYKWNCLCCKQLIVNNRSLSQLWAKCERHFDICDSKGETTIDIFKAAFVNTHSDVVFRDKRGIYHK